MRVDREAEIMGLDVRKHDERAYPECKKKCHINNESDICP
jgi:ammonia channel protein AmtB